MEFLNQNNYVISDNIILKNGAIPLTWWTVSPNFGDLLSPYLIEKMTSKPVVPVYLKTGSKRKLKFLNFSKTESSYLAIGSIISRAKSNSIVWGSGAFGTEGEKTLSQHAKYLAVRGPLTRNLLRIHGIQCPEVYGDPALLIPQVFNPKVEKKYKVGVILRWSETEWQNSESDNTVKKINFGTDDIEGTLIDILSCEKIFSSSLHGLIIADAFGIPSAWLSSTTPKGLEFKFYDYFLSVNKLQKPQAFDLSRYKLTLETLEQKIQFNDDAIEFDSAKLLAACPFINQR